MIKDRGNIKWKSALMLPEHRALLSQIEKEQYYVEQPILEEEHLEEINRSFHYAIENETTVMVTYYQEHALKTIRGKIKSYDKVKNLIYLVTLEKEVVSIPSMNIIQIDY